MPPPVNLRPKRSRKDRPCDLCRGRKQLCVIAVRGQPCQRCARKNIQCSFDIEVPKKKTVVDPEVPMDEDEPEAGPSNYLKREQSKGSSLHALLFAKRRMTPDETDIYFDSLDMSTTETSESHYIGNKLTSDPAVILAHSLSPPNAIGQGSASKSQQQRINQISKNEQEPAFFKDSPSFFLGSKVDGVQERYDAICAMLPDDWSKKLYDSFVSQTLPAWPVVNAVRLHVACTEEPGAGPYPYSLMSTIIGHSMAYHPEVFPHFHSVWQKILQTEDTEYRQPKLQNLQLSAIDLSTIPNHAEYINTVTLSKAIAVAHLLGLHVDCSKWRLPRWEMSLRIRMWWALFVLDKWHSLAHGRPTLMKAEDQSVPLPEVEDADWGAETSASHKEAMRSFIGICKLSLILGTFLDKFHTVGRRGSIAVLEDLVIQLDNLEQSLHLPNTSVLQVRVTGVCNLQLSILGVRFALARMQLKQSASDREQLFASSLLVVPQLSTELSKFMEGLTDADFKSFWMPHNVYIITTNLATLFWLLDEQRICGQEGDDNAVGKQVCEFITLLQSLDTRGWLVARLAVERIKSLMSSSRVVEEHPELSSLFREDNPQQVEEPAQDPLAIHMQDFEWVWGANLWDPLDMSNFFPDNTALAGPSTMSFGEEYPNLT